jgi:uncharacterized repeat protein (TIGR01451 family)
MSAPDRPSRQQLVVPPRNSNLPVMIGFVASGCLGFALVWALGVGRAPPPPAVDDASMSDVGPRPGAASDIGAPTTPPQPAAPISRPVIVDPALEPASLDVPDALPPGPDQPSRFSRFSARDLEPPAPQQPADDAPAELASPQPELEPTTTDATPADATPRVDSAEATSPDTPPPAKLALPPAAELAPLAEADAEAAVGETAAARGTNIAASDLEPSPLDAVSAPPLEPSPTAADLRDPAPPPVTAPPFTAAPAATPSSTAPPVAAPPVGPPAAAADVAPPPAAPSPFAAAPPLVPGRGGPGSLDRALDEPGMPAPGSAGQGRPGPAQLEGIQTPQVSVEKRGPREIQVGKPARYEVLVRNIGTATAHDVVLRDSVPYGTALVTTTPPAAPGQPGPAANASELVWHLGTLAPGGQSRIVIELMPQAEGEIGSVASVTFRADASVRSRSTKPALQLACSEPDAVLIGSDAGLTITVTNPGTGVATGVILEGFLPENVSHRSGSELEFDVGQLKPGESRTIELVLGTRGPGVHTARLAARADGGIEVQQAVRLEVTAPTLELAVDMPVRRFLQRPATCAISMVNAGTAPARAVELAAQLPPGMKFVRANNAGWYDDRTHRVLWNLEELPPGETGTVEAVVMPVQHGPQKILAAARSADGPADQVVHVCEVEGLAALFFEVADSEDPIEVEGLTEYVVRVGNQGTAPATGVRLTATLLGDLEPVEAQGPAGHRIDNLTIAFEPLAKLAPAEEAVFRVRARGRSQGDHRVQVQLVSEDHPTPITKEEITRVYRDR